MNLFCLVVVIRLFFLIGAILGDRRLHNVKHAVALPGDATYRFAIFIRFGHWGMQSVILGLFLVVFLLGELSRFVVALQHVATRVSTRFVQANSSSELTFFSPSLIFDQLLAISDRPSRYDRFENISLMSWRT